MKYLLLASNLLSGIGQVMIRYKDLFIAQGHTVEFRLYNENISDDTFDVGFAFLLPFITMMDRADAHMHRCTRKVRMTVCETDPVHESYSIFSRYKDMLVPSEFSRQILQKQFPNIRFKLYYHWARVMTIPKSVSATCYTFYTIGNIVDFRKNISMLLRAMSIFPKARLVMKASCRQPVNLQQSNVIVLNQFMTEEQLDRLHHSCHCYINCSHSEGVGMGAVEAALRNKPVILSEHGGCIEYVKSKWIISCKPTTVGRDEFLFKKDAIWGDPSFDDLVKHMRTCYENFIDFDNHEHTQIIMNSLIHKPLC
jgi:glycosyltransferase involved in cell wall biosynthesis